MRTDRELLAIADTIEERLTALEQELRGTRAALQNQGFDRLDSLYFERHEPGDPETAWRTGFSLAAVAEGYPLPRERSVSSDGERESLTEEVYEQLTAGEHVVVVGETGSGKSTVCKQVACQWHAETDRGAVLYRRSASTTTFDEPGTLIEAIRSDEDDLLVVVEDAPRADANTIFEVLDTLGESEEVAVLLDARTGTWESDSPMGGQTCGTRRHRDVQDYTHRGQRANRQPCEAHTAGLRAHRLPYDRGDSTALYTCVRRRYTTGALPDGQNRS
ncbi:ATP-binding cassette domain-containing protein [Halocatena marina]|uniref:ATP-binding cassette domain-containing protein n=1 Tax=Halocatena marina TaxID=2934937 RepID=A0ABD5YTJ1_9EURY